MLEPGMPKTERLGPLDKVFLEVENDGPPAAVGGIMEMEGKAPTLAAFRKFIQSRLPGMERFRQVVDPAPLRVRAPKWKEVEVDINHHVTQIKLKPGDSLDPVVTKLISKKLDRAYPLWDMNLVTGYKEGEWAIIMRMSHSIADGQGASILMGQLIDLNPEGSMSLADGIVAMTKASLGNDHNEDDKDLTRAEKARKAAYDGFAELGNFISAIPASVETLRKGFVPQTASELAGPVSNKRLYVHDVYDLAAVKEARKSFKGATINDIVLTAVAQGFRAMLEARGSEVPPNRTVRALMPISLRKDLRSNNQIGMLPAPLPVGETDLKKSMKKVNEYTKISKQSWSPYMLDDIIKVSNKITPTLFQEWFYSKTADWGEMLADAIVTNVPGSPVPVYVMGHKLVQSSPVIPIFAGVRICVGVTSYRDNLNIGITGDGENAKDVDVLLEGIIAGFDAICELAAAKSK